MIEREHVRDVLLKMLPSFQPTLSEYLEDWALEDPPGICLELAQFGRYVADLLAEGNIDYASAGLAAIEQLLQDGTPQVKDAASTCALESLDGHAAAAGLDPRRWGSLLPSAAKASLSDWHGDLHRYEP